MSSSTRRCNGGRVFPKMEEEYSQILRKCIPKTTKSSELARLTELANASSSTSILR